MLFRSGADLRVLDQSRNGGEWVSLGTFTLAGDGADYVELSDLGGATAADAVRLLSDPPNENDAAAEVYYVHTDHLGTPKTITDRQQSVVWAAAYLPFGQADVTTELLVNNLRFPGQYFDAESGLHYNYFRDYDPSIGRYIQPDPIGLAGGINSYSYARENPLSNADRMGLHPSLILDMSKGVIPTGGVDITIGVFGCGIGCASFSSDDLETQASIEAVLGGGLSFCVTPPNSNDERSSADANCTAERKGCGLYDPNCDNHFALPGLSAPGKLGFLVGGSISPKGQWCLNFGPHMGLPLPSMQLGDLYE